MEEEVSLEPPTKKQKTDEATSADNDDFSKDVEISGISDQEFVNKDYNNYVDPEELQKLREFQVLDEVKSNDEDSQEESDLSDGKSEGVPEDEIEKMLEEDLPEGFKGAPKPKEKPYVMRQKIVLEEKGVNQFEVLPLDWMMARHYSGLPVYVHRATRVATLAKPYFLGVENTRRHDIPISAIPCYAYRRALEEEAKQKEIDRQIEEQIRTGSWKQNMNINNGIDEGNDVTNTVNKCPFKSNDTKQNSVSNCPYKRGQIVENETKSKGDKDVNESKENGTNGNEETITDKGVSESDTDENGAIKNKELIVVENSSKNLENGTNSETTLEENQTLSENTAANGTTSEASQEITNTDSQETNEVKVEENGAKAPDEPKRSRIQPVVLPGGLVMPPPRVETVSTSWKTQHLTPDEVNDYCKKLFKFKTVNIMHFVHWADRRKYTKARRALQFPAPPAGTRLITIPASNAAPGGKATKRDWVMNMNGRSYLSVFHEYVRRALQKQPVYEFKQLENASTPYQATVFIGGMQYGVGRGSSKRAAKSEAAQRSIRILIPEMADLDPPPSANPDPDFSFFDSLGIEDPRIAEFCAATCEPSPHAILRTCLLRNFGAGERHIHTEMKKLEYQKIELTMKVGKHSASVVCKNKKAAKQRASQAILQALHPHVKSWGSLLRLYGSRSVKSCKERKLEEQQITLLQDAAKHNEPNYAVLEKLRNEMLKLRERDEAVVPIGTLLVKDDLPTHSGSNLNNVDL